MKEVAIKLSGPAGAGMMQAGEILSRALNRAGFYSLMYPEYPSRIRGGDNQVEVVFSSEKWLAPTSKIDLLLAFGKELFEKHKKELKEGSEGWGFEAGDWGLGEIAEEIGNSLVANMAGLGFIWFVLGFDLKVLLEEIRKEFGENGEILKLNLKAAEKGFEKGKEWGKRMEVEFQKIEGRIDNYSGNEALVEGALKAGVGFVAVYPMTPVNSILSLAVANREKGKIQVFYPEDEIAGIMAGLGASLAGKKVLVATSGGGFSLMVEGLGMAGMAEIPLVIVLGQRTGPSTGMATFTSQADLKFVIGAGQGEFPRIVLTPGEAEECLFLGEKAFSLAEKYQVPVILLTDKYLAEGRFSLESNLQKGGIEEPVGEELESGEYRRYRLTESGISPRKILGEGVFWTNSYEHDEFGLTTEDQEIRVKMMEKRMRKLADLKGGIEIKEGKRGWKKGVTLVGWGSTKQGLLSFCQKHEDFNLIHFWRVWPFPKEAEEILRKTGKIVVVEGNYSGQMAEIIEGRILKKVERVTKDDGRPFYKEELEEKIERIR